MYKVQTKESDVSQALVQDLLEKDFKRTMTQDIKFRYRLKNKSGDLKTVVFTLQAIEGGALLPYFGNYWEVIARNRWTGLKDKNGVEIFERDLVNAPACCNKQPHEVYYETGTYSSFYIRHADGHRTGFACFTEGKFADEVVGTAYDNQN